VIRGRMEQQGGTALMGKSASRVMRMAPAAEPGVQGVVAGPAASSQADAVGMAASAAPVGPLALPTMGTQARPVTPPPHSPTPLPAAWAERVEQGTLPSFHLTAIEPPRRTAATANPGRMARMARMAGRGYPPIAEASSVRAMDRTDRMASMARVVAAVAVAEVRAISCALLVTPTVLAQVVAVGVRAARVAKAVEAAAAGEGRLESIFTITAPMGAL
jgi:hypothetical protein